MKKFWIIFSCYILILSVLPCSDIDACILNTNTSEWQQSNHHNHHEHEEDHCSPFCTCACCGISIAQHHIPKFIIQQQSILRIEKKLSFFSTIYAKDISSIIWQPPKL